MTSSFGHSRRTVRQTHTKVHSLSGLIGFDTLKLSAACLLIQISTLAAFRGAESVAAFWVVGPASDTATQLIFHPFCSPLSYPPAVEECFQLNPPAIRSCVRPLEAGLNRPQGVLKVSGPELQGLLDPRSLTCIYYMTFCYSEDHEAGNNLILKYFF